jgi:hypothetical protein
MTVFLIILGVIGGLIGALLVLALFTKRGFAVERAIVIDSSSAQAYDYLRYIGNHDNFNTSSMRDLDKIETYTGTDGTVGFVYGWNGNKKVGEGEKEIKVLIPGKKVEIEIRFKRPFTAVSQTLYTLDAVSATSTKVTAGVRSNLNYPMNIMLVFMNMDKHLGKDLETSLVTLKGILEK